MDEEEYKKQLKKIWEKTDSNWDDTAKMKSWLNSEFGYRANVNVPETIGNYKRHLNERNKRLEKLEHIIYGNGKMGLRTIVMIMWRSSVPIGVLLGVLLKMGVDKIF